MVKHRNIFLVYLFMIITFGIYSLVWLVKTKNEFNSLGAKVPTAWLIIIPIVNLYWLFKYYQAFGVNVKKDNNTALWFILGLFISIIMPLIVQMELNKIASGNIPSAKAESQIATQPPSEVSQEKKESQNQPVQVENTQAPTQPVGAPQQTLQTQQASTNVVQQ